LVGIDEAGYGPLLGPLTVTAAGFRLPDEHLRGDLWALLKKAVSKQKKGLKGRLLITDSKKAYTRKAGPVHLRRTVLASLKSLDPPYPSHPDGAHELLNILCPLCAPRLAGYPWYASLDGQPLGDDDAAVDIAANVFRLALAENRMQFVMLTSRCLDVGYYNKMVSTVKNKSRVLFTAICGLLQEIFDSADAGENLQVVVDRQGGRVNYRDPLARMFPGFDIAVLRQDENDSSYELTGRGKTMRIHFVVKADLRFMPVSLASMTSKYLREVLIDSLNGYFLGHCPQIKPTAGYWQDGLRFVADLKKHLGDLQYDEDKLIRSR
jgi:hypothetical protein